MFKLVEYLSFRTRGIQDALYLGTHTRSLSALVQKSLSFGDLGIRELAQQSSNSSTGASPAFPTRCHSLASAFALILEGKKRYKFGG
jgi:hypothetical protein